MCLRHLIFDIVLNKKGVKCSCCANLRQGGRFLIEGKNKSDRGE